MKAIVNYEYVTPDVLQLEQDEKPTPNDNDILEKAHAASVNQGKWYYLIGGPLQPKTNIHGGDVAGWVETVGKNVKQFEIGKEVFGDISGSGLSASAEYVAAPENVFARNRAIYHFWK